MKSSLLASSAVLLLGLAGCASTPSATESSSEPPSVTASASATSAAPTSSRTSASPAPLPTTNASASGIAQSLTCINISSIDPPRGASPVPSSAVRCNLGAQGYLVLAYSTEAAATEGLSQLRSQAESTGETVIVAAGTTWIVRPAEGTSIGNDMVRAARAVGGKKKALP